ncbi:MULTISPECIES: beta-ketoacyl synthase chain length factor [Acinetobacter]|uniref:Beta-ketoacyl synthase n=2 Tax=Acinetobacter TaxID=469 RepID=A0A4Q7AV57_9GAMM|nr:MULTISPECIES: beta-ketoacyl synthase chain length factor [Acinetobacter]MCW8039453.1 beta-ketoacyl synthase chain length factor [Acinetobacter entericus]RZG66317.1 beta-ketoacyl synthase [Acinetobacter bouvetii]TCB73458.1 beta-ketoacyl synthase [Acinetobacter sp. ANC 4177]
MVLLNVSQLTISQADGVFPALEYIPAMQRRRLSRLAKLALNSAIQTLDTHNADYIVWVSQYGDEAKTLNILEDVLSEQTPSPTQFSTSVHNAISGLYSILCQDATPATSLAGSWNDGLIEAYAWLKTRPEARQVLLVYYDEALPDIYIEHQPFAAFAMAAMISLAPANLMLMPKHTDSTPAYQQALAFNTFWTNPDQTESEAWTKC